MTTVDGSTDTDMHDPSTTSSLITTGHKDPPYLWVPYLVLSMCLVGLAMASFIRFHIRNKYRYRDRKSTIHVLHHFNQKNQNCRSSVAHNENAIISIGHNKQIHKKSSKKQSGRKKSSKKSKQSSISEHLHSRLHSIKYAETKMCPLNAKSLASKSNYRQPLLVVTGNFHTRKPSNDSSISDSSPINGNSFSYLNNAFEINEDERRVQNNTLSGSRDDLRIRSTSIGSYCDLLSDNREQRDHLPVGSMPSVDTTQKGKLRSNANYLQTIENNEMNQNIAERQLCQTSSIDSKDISISVPSTLEPQINV